MIRHSARYEFHAIFISHSYNPKHSHTHTKNGGAEEKLVLVEKKEEDVLVESSRCKWNRFMSDDNLQN